MKKTKRLLALLLAASLWACGSSHTEDASDGVELTLWTYPAGNWGDQDTVERMVAQFNRDYPDIHVTVQCLDTETADDSVSTAVDAGLAPDVLLAKPEQLVKTWGSQGLLADLSDLWDDGDRQEVNEAVSAACCKALNSLGRSENSSSAVRGSGL